MPIGDPALTLIQREAFLQDTLEIARLCHWNEKQLKGLKSYIWQKLVEVDNKIIDVLEQSNDEIEALNIWTEGMEEIRYSVSLMLGIKIRYL